ncbi:MAG: TPM domain-containing protein [Aquabacterium sp.]|nr:TPM domain-containing protein [Aquabacterium sp.]
MRAAWTSLSRIAALLLTLFALLFSTLVLSAEPTGDVLPVPPLSGHVIDSSQTLSTAQAQALEQKLSAFERAHGTQMVILLVPSTQPEDIAAFAQRVGETWKIGRRDVGDGLLIVVAKQDRRIRIEVAKALEGAVPDLAASRVIEQAIKPAFKAGDYAGGLNRGVDQLVARIQGENLPAPEARTSEGRHPSGDGFQFNDLMVFGLIGIPIVFGVLSAILGRKLGALATGSLGGFLIWVVTSSLFLAIGGGIIAIFLALAFGNGGGRRGGPGSWGGPPTGGGWSSGGGGWSSGGGGDFGGGGASGNW